MAVFAYFLVKQKFSSFSVNAVFLLALGAGVLALNSSTDRPEGESQRDYVRGFIVAVGGTASYGLILPLTELMYQKANQVVNYQLVMEIQMVMCLFATIFCTGGCSLTMTSRYAFYACSNIIYSLEHLPETRNC